MGDLHPYYFFRPASSEPHSVHIDLDDGDDDYDLDFEQYTRYHRI